MKLIKNNYKTILFFILFSISGALPALAESQVYFNVANHKVHKLTCHWGQVCTKNCIVIPRSEAYQKRHGVACKVCGG